MGRYMFCAVVFLFKRKAAAAGNKFSTARKIDATFHILSVAPVRVQSGISFIL